MDIILLSFVCLFVRLFFLRGGGGSLPPKSPAVNAGPRDPHGKGRGRGLLLSFPSRMGPKDTAEEGRYGMFSNLPCMQYIDPTCKMKLTPATTSTNQISQVQEFWGQVPFHPPPQKNTSNLHDPVPSRQDLNFARPSNPVPWTKVQNHHLGSILWRHINSPGTIKPSQKSHNNRDQSISKPIYQPKHKHEKNSDCKT